jgi:aromatic ring-cleaving dioxygenase
MQREELRVQRKELALTRTVFAQQTFEATFFRMLEMLRDIESTVRVGEAVGDRAWTWYNRNITEGAFGSIKTHDPEAIRQQIAQYYENEFYPKHEPSLGPYFRALYNLLEIIDRQKQLGESEKAMYANIVRSQLSGHALIVLAVNGCSDTVAKGMRRYIVKYRLMKHLPASNFRTLISNIYPNETFEGRPAIDKDPQRG